MPQSVSTPVEAATDSSAPELSCPPTPLSVPRSARPDDWFEDMTGRSGVRFAYRTGWEGGHYTVLESMGGGVALWDYDGDGNLDLFFPGGGKIDGAPRKIEGWPAALYRNDGDWHFVDVAVPAGLEIAGDYTRPPLPAHRLLSNMGHARLCIR